MYQSSVAVAENLNMLESAGITYIFNCEKCTKPKIRTKFIYHKLDLKDRKDQPISTHFEDVYKLLMSALRRMVRF